MSNSQKNGKGYEFAWMSILEQTLSKNRKIQIIKNSNYDQNSRAWESLTDALKKTFKISAESAIDTLIEIEPLMAEQAEDTLDLEFKSDQAGIEGDVRDIVVSRKDIKWEIGLSIKHKHKAVKHSRLSPKIDFGNEWYGIPCSEEYWQSVNPIFERINKEKKLEKNWCDLSDKNEAIYVPILKAFMNEIKKASTKQGMVKNLISFLIGTNDYHKIISEDDKNLTIIYSFNVHGTLNKPSKSKVSAITIPKVKLPTELIDIRFKRNSLTTVEMYLNNGWQLSFRIHSASTKVESSLKFDIQYIGMPPEVVCFECRWKK